MDFGTVRVPVAGPLEAVLAFLAQSPGEIEEEEGEPLVGRSGRVLQKAAAKAGLEWISVYRTNVFKFRLLASDGDKIKELVRANRGLIFKELNGLPDLRLVVTFGNEALFCLTGMSGITSIRGQIFKGKGEWYSLATLHPSYILRKKSKDLFKQLVGDLVKARKMLDKIALEEAEG